MCLGKPRHRRRRNPLCPIRIVLQVRSRLFVGRRRPRRAAMILVRCSRLHRDQSAFNLQQISRFSFQNRTFSLTTTTSFHRRSSITVHQCSRQYRSVVLLVFVDHHTEWFDDDLSHIDREQWFDRPWRTATIGNDSIGTSRGTPHQYSTSSVHQ